MPPDRTTTGPQSSDEIYFEFVPAGAYVRVTAIHARTGTEATIVGAARAPRAALEQVALNKLRRILAGAR